MRLGRPHFRPPDTVAQRSMTMTAEPQSFEEAVARFEVFLKENGYSQTLIWVEPADLVLPGRRAIYVRVPVPSRNL